MKFNKNILTRKNLLYFTGTWWGILGFNRGINQYEYEQKYDNYFKKPYFYTDKISSGVFGFMIYVIPYFLPFVVYKEIYRLEIILRGLEEEKTTRSYHKILF
jgi:hypothetical protein